MNQRKETEPRIQLDDLVGIDTDAYNWILLRRNRKEDGTFSQWSAKSFYQSLPRLLEALLEIRLREGLGNDLQATVESAQEAVLASVRRVKSETDALASLVAKVR